MSDDQPPRLPADPGPDWWPRFNWRQIAGWTLEGLLIPLAIFVGVWIFASIFLSLSSGAFLSEEGVRNGGTIAIFGYFLTGGAIVLTLIFNEGAKWRTFFRVIGFTIAIVVQWKLSEVILAHI